MSEVDRNNLLVSTLPILGLGVFHRMDLPLLSGIWGRWESTTKKPVPIFSVRSAIPIYLEEMESWSLGMLWFLVPLFRRSSMM